VDPGLADHGGVLSVTQVLQTNLKQARDSPRDLTYEAQRIKDLEKELRELRRSNVILRSASACLSRRSVSAPSPDLAVQRKTTPWARFRAAQRVFYDARRAKAEAAMTARVPGSNRCCARPRPDQTSLSCSV